jgi:hypothetical protein
MAAYVVPREVQDAKEVARELSAILGKDESEILLKLSDPTDPFEMIKRRLSDDEVGRIRTLSLKGVSLLPEKYRYYPAGSLASHVVGFAGLGEQGGAGGYGVEASFDSELKGKPARVHSGFVKFLVNQSKMIVLLPTLLLAHVKRTWNKSIKKGLHVSCGPLTLPFCYLFFATTKICFLVHILHRHICYKVYQLPLRLISRVASTHFLS